MEVHMKANKLILAGSAVVIALASWTHGIAAEKSTVGSARVKHVLLLSIDGMHAVDSERGCDLLG
jgi:hypothetical protein